MDLTRMADRHLLHLHRTGKKNGARPFLRHPRAMMALREELERRKLAPMDPFDVQIINHVLDQIEVWKDW